MPRRSTHEREADLEFINKLYLQGWSQSAIALEVNRVRGYEISQQSVSNDIAELQKRWQQNTTIDLDEHKQKELARIDLLEREYWEQYEASKEDYETITKKARDTGKDNRNYEVSTRTETRTGNPAYLQGVERCIKMRMDLLGLEAAKDLNVNHKQIIIKSGQSMDDI